MDAYKKQVRLFKNYAEKYGIDYKENVCDAEVAIILYLNLDMEDRSIFFEWTKSEPDIIYLKVRNNKSFVDDYHRWIRFCYKRNQLMSLNPQDCIENVYNTLKMYKMNKDRLEKFNVFTTIDNLSSHLGLDFQLAQCDVDPNIYRDYGSKLNFYIAKMPKGYECKVIFGTYIDYTTSECFIYLDLILKNDFNDVLLSLKYPSINAGIKEKVYDLVKKQIELFK